MVTHSPGQGPGPSVDPDPGPDPDPDPDPDLDPGQMQDPDLDPGQMQDPDPDPRLMPDPDLDPAQVPDQGPDLDLDSDWSVSFAGCGFMAVYYIGAAACVLERAPGLFTGASRICGASCGSVVAALLAVGTPLDKCCAELMSMAQKARGRGLGPLHPTFNLLQLVQDALKVHLPEDAHIRATGKLGVSLTRVADGKNVLVSEFDSKDELIQALICSCFIPFYCGLIPPTYRGVRYVDGAASDNLPHCHLKKTITFSAYAGESDICPPMSALNLHEVRFNNVSIQVNWENVRRVANTFFPPDAEAMAQICQNGFMDALRFLQKNNLISPSPQTHVDPDPFRPCCEFLDQTEPDQTQKNHQNHQWLNPQFIEKLPLNLRTILCDACKRSCSSGGLLSNVSSYLRTPHALPMTSRLAQRFMDWIPDVYGLAGDVFRRTRKKQEENKDEEEDKEEDKGQSVRLLRRCSSLPSDLNLWDHREPHPMTPEATPTSSLAFTWDHMPLTPPPTPTFSPALSGLGFGLNHATGWTTAQGPKKTEEEEQEEGVDQK
ncbi:patatin-like phospholipase domain-containing protein 2 [Sphaeramia orbicularis]|uniref:patatin-like phospholipase domain-containing protein 2 n=1 Tax=Sphaeramia orbicularis TaxID=375764 RepID=UPI00117E2E85|nr:patatin-like phospholipase domain-containing protein 2 [Sphaeramia orbicularis]